MCSTNIHEFENKEKGTESQPPTKNHYHSQQDGFYILTNAEGEDCVVHLYTNPDTKIRGFGFGVWDGAGFLPLTDIRADSRVTYIELPDTAVRNGKTLMKSEVLAAFAFCVVKQSPYDVPDITAALTALNAYLSEYFPDSDTPVEMTYAEIKEMLRDEVYETIPAIEILNHRKNKRDGISVVSRFHTPHPDDDFIDLGALSRNVFNMVVLESNR